MARTWNVGLCALSLVSCVVLASPCFGSSDKDRVTFHTRTPTSTITTTGCNTSADCSFAGECVAGACQCDAAFSGSGCESLALEGMVYRTITNVPGVHINGTIINTIWGGHPIASVSNQDNSTPSWTWFGSAITNGRSLADWATGSVISRAVANYPAPTITNPATKRTGDGANFKFNLSAVVIEPVGLGWDGGSMHGVYPIVNPYPWSNGSDAYLIFYTGFEKGPTAMASRKIGVAYAPSVMGPWTRWPTPVFGPNENQTAKDTSSVSNSAPAFANDGSGRILLAYKGLGHADSQKSTCTDGSGKPCVFVASAPHWSGPYNRITANAGVVIEGEDPTLWQDKRGAWHMIYEHYVDINGVMHCGHHAYSETGTSEWQLTLPSTCYTTQMDFQGTNLTVRKRERPQIVMAPGTQTPIALFNGICIEEACFNAYQSIST
eukprot:m.140078 g.140078  ORF g.140078 m.140078 type:complete len:436 (+) comp30100_c1_seq2:158-1465(+)